jgi:hypothetical protein
MLILALYWPREKLWAALLVGAFLLIAGFVSALRQRRSLANLLGGLGSAAFGGCVAAWAALMLFAK